MNLIEQFGGYEKAKAIVTQNIKDFEEAVDEVGIYHPSSGWIVHEDLVKELLEYRRQHNIFEVGDKVVYVDDFMPDSVSVVSEVNDRVWLNDNNAVCIKEIIKHAEDEEIKAGKRLEVS